MDSYAVKLAIRDQKNPDAKRPIGYLLSNDRTKWLAVIGHYEIACGGCDTISDMGEVFAKVKEAHDLGYDVLFEGAIVSTLARNVIELHVAGYPVEVISLNTPLDVCLMSINARREAKWDERCKVIDLANEAIRSGAKKGKIKDYPERPEPVNPKTTKGKFASTKSTHAKIEAAGIPAVWASRDEAETLIKQRLGLV
jgi:hypothetical protein